GGHRLRGPAGRDAVGLVHPAGRRRPGGARLRAGSRKDPLDEALASSDPAVLAARLREELVALQGVREEHAREIEELRVLQRQLKEQIRNRLGVAEFDLEPSARVLEQLARLQQGGSADPRVDRLTAELEES